MDVRLIGTPCTNRAFIFPMLINRSLILHLLNQNKLAEKDVRGGRMQGTSRSDRGVAKINCTHKTCA